MRRSLFLLCGFLFLVAAACSEDDETPPAESAGGTTTTTIVEETTTTVAPETMTTTTAPPETTTTTTVPPRGEAVAVPSIMPVTGGERGGLPANPAPREILEEYDYVEEEYFISGRATAYAPVGELGRDGNWEVEPAGTAPFTTRILVRRPADPADANGVVGV